MPRIMVPLKRDFNDNDAYGNFKFALINHIERKVM